MPDEYTCREDYPEGFHRRCIECAEGRPISKFPDDPDEPDGISQACSHCDRKVKARKAATAAKDAARADMRAQQAAIPTDDLGPPEVIESPGSLQPVFDDADHGVVGVDVTDPGDAEPEPPVEGEGDVQEQEQTSAAVNNGEATRAAKDIIEDEGLDLVEIPGREGDGRVTVAEVRAFMATEG